MVMPSSLLPKIKNGWFNLIAIKRFGLISR